MQTVITADVVDFDTKQKFDRVVSIEMFEHMKNYQVHLEPLFARAASILYVSLHNAGESNQSMKWDLRMCRLCSKTYQNGSNRGVTCLCTSSPTRP